ncbi:13S globulin basic chain like [Actinidia chinensis var. chinensis]|uniref:13S globulin basic chain like n=1 Tax=Actinidia chinensis var. chinensis TaxID=1590841 RepID=A0A2R6Q6I0_ACTCC|nr:13S globulin basic chain like [Actinidia chinensis var. chinensis]
MRPQVADKKVFEGDGGSYWSWSSSKFPLLSEAKVGAGRLLLHPRGFALPHYADSSKIGYVVQGSCTVGMVFPNTSKEKVVTIKQGDAIPVGMGVVSWWFNGGDSDLVIVFVGETSEAHVPGEFTYFLLTGTMGALIIKLEEGISIPQACKGTPGNENELLDKQVGLSATLVKLKANEVSSPIYVADSGVRVTYVVKGSGRVQIVGINGERVLDAEVKAGDLFVVPRFFVAMEAAGGEGMECFSVITSPQPVFGQLNGNASVWKAFSPAVLQNSLGVDSEFAELFTSHNTNGTIGFAPTN